jgi:hypothetical protein
MSSGMSVQYSSSSSADHSRYIASPLSTPEPEAAGGQRVPFHYTAARVAPFTVNGTRFTFYGTGRVYATGCSSSRQNLLWQGTSGVRRLAWRGSLRPKLPPPGWRIVVIKRPHPLVADRAVRNALCSELDHLRFHVVAHQIELMFAVSLGGAEGDLGRRNGEDQLAPAGIDCWKAEHTSEERAICLSGAGINDRVHSGNHGFPSPCLHLVPVTANCAFSPSRGSRQGAERRRNCLPYLYRLPFTVKCVRNSPSSAAAGPGRQRA